MTERTTVLECGSQATAARFVVWLMMAASLPLFYAAWAVFQWFGISSGDGGVLRPLSERIMLAGFLGLLATAIIGGAMLYASLFVLKLTTGDDDTVEIDTLTPWAVGSHRHTFARSQIGKTNYHHGRMTLPRGVGGIPVAQEIDAPGITLYVSGRLLPFVLDLRAKTVNKDALSKLASNAVGSWQADTQE